MRNSRTKPLTFSEPPAGDAELLRPAIGDAPSIPWIGNFLPNGLALWQAATDARDYAVGP